MNATDHDIHSLFQFLAQDNWVTAHNVSRNIHVYVDVRLLSHQQSCSGVRYQL